MQEREMAGDKRYGEIGIDDDKKGLERQGKTLLHSGDIT